ncbi:uncharacterized protein K444DRAFT_612699 [Hyaloscypha bicolor E]|uniref:Uncharacterized protein n=1 Tax=Hyaloscypha bicolor E TaxID=1095630 RepID=A0A2J6TC08_9HELO|nr:uncharacterized protein K444DRAFT_612699 [Hyaloscypha bicolor E]PMD60567.1 hypothetical protein K444DRAFT_612699 [Hyaloscypha bicolor E]
MYPANTFIAPTPTFKATFPTLLAMPAASFVVADPAPVTLGLAEEAPTGVASPFIT